jgi:hypothetical protein
VVDHGRAAVRRRGLLLDSLGLRVGADMLAAADEISRRAAGSRRPGR